MNNYNYQEINLCNNQVCDDGEHYTNFLNLMLLSASIKLNEQNFTSFENFANFRISFLNAKRKFFELYVEKARNTENNAQNDDNNQILQLTQKIQEIQNINAELEEFMVKKAYCFLYPDVEENCGVQGNKNIINQNTNKEKYINAVDYFFDLAYKKSETESIYYSENIQKEIKKKSYIAAGIALFVGLSTEYTLNYLECNFASEMLKKIGLKSINCVLSQSVSLLLFGLIFAAIVGVVTNYVLNKRSIDNSGGKFGGVSESFISVHGYEEINEI